MTRLYARPTDHARPISPHNGAISFAVLPTNLSYSQVWILISLPTSFMAAPISGILVEAWNIWTQEDLDLGFYVTLPSAYIIELWIM